MIIGIIGKKQTGKNTVANELSRLFAENLNDSSWTHKSFAYKIKQILSLLTGIPVEHMEKEEVKNSYLPKEWNKCFVETFNQKLGPFYSGKKAIDFINKMNIRHFKLEKAPITVRQALQWIGTDLFRYKFDEDTWINALFSEYVHENKYSLDLNSLPKEVNILEACANPEKCNATIIDKESKWIITDVRFPNEAQSVIDRGGVLIKIERPSLKESDKHPSETSIDFIRESIINFKVYNDGDLTELYSKIEAVFNLIIKHFNLNK